MDVLVRIAVNTTSCRPPAEAAALGSRPCARSTWASSTACPAARPSCPTSTSRRRAWRSARCAICTAASTSTLDAGRRAAQLVEWDRRTPLRPLRRTHRARARRARSPLSGLRHAAFPRLSPAVIVRVTRGDEILLARAQRFPGRLCSVLAASSSRASRSRSASRASSRRRSASRSARSRTSPASPGRSRTRS